MNTGLRLRDRCFAVNVVMLFETQLLHQHHRVFQTTEMCIEKKQSTCAEHFSFHFITFHYLVEQPSYRNIIFSVSVKVSPLPNFLLCGYLMMAV